MKQCLDYALSGSLSNAAETDLTINAVLTELVPSLAPLLLEQEDKAKGESEELRAVGINEEGDNNPHNSTRHKSLKNNHENFRESL